ncbi:MAG: mechanosensitive ion channel [Schleiferiaceae bacterium]|jgi:small conductance mechanosensitive channel|nr:mechanosensitive ion channel [Schleiferiaceae bacterium]
MGDFDSAAIKDMIVSYGIQIVIAIVILIIGLWVVKIIQSGIRKGLEKKGTDPSLQGFTLSLTGMALKIMLVIAVISQLGVETTSFIAVLGAAGLAVGMALSGTLQNFAGGAMILIFKPFKVGDFIEAQGYSGSVSEIQIFVTILKTPDNKTIIIPNGGLSTGSLINYSAEPTRRVDWTFGIGYGDDANKAQEVIKGLLDADNRVMKDPAIFVEVSELADSSVNFATRAWVKAEDYWGVYFDMNKKVYEEFDKVGLNIPYPQMDVHVHKS